jgi:18S rRNA (adenine1779-N6/adenine1780-N6)-dimethyltransferase
MFQREFAMRLFAKPGDKLYSRLSVNAQMWAKIDYVMKVGRNNFSPPPLVESSVVRITPIVPRPAINFEEWDGLLRICFVRKNKMLRSSFFGTTSVMDMLESNYRTWCAQNDILIEDELAKEGKGDEEMDIDAVDEWEGIIDEDVENDEDEDELAQFPKDRKIGTSTKKEKKGKVSKLVGAKVKRVLDRCKLTETRARMCDQNDFLRLLEGFNEEGIHFA